MSLSRIGSVLALAVALGGCVTTAPKSSPAQKVQLGIGERLDICLPPQGRRPETTLSMELYGLLALRDLATGEVVGTACGVGMSKRNRDGLSKTGMVAVPMGQTAEVQMAEDAKEGEGVMLVCWKDGFSIDASHAGAMTMACAGIAPEPMPPRPPVATLSVPSPTPAATPAARMKEDQI